MHLRFRQRTIILFGFSLEMLRWHIQYWYIMLVFTRRLQHILLYSRVKIIFVENHLKLYLSICI